MRLRKQLLFASLFTLSLPWVGCQYLREMENTLLEGQAEALNATAIAVASTIESDPELVRALDRYSAPSGTTPIYLQPFFSPHILDGYREDWVSYAYQPQVFQPRPKAINAKNDTENKPVLVYAGKRGAQASFFFRIPATTIRYYQPGKNIELHNRLKLLFPANNDANENLNKDLIERYIVASSPGNANALFYEGNADAQDARPKEDHRIKAVWREWEQGYQIEIQLPFELVNSGLAFEVLEAQRTYSSYSNLNQTAQKNTEYSLPPTHFQSPQLEEKLAIFQREGVRLRIASRHASYVASAGKLNEAEQMEEDLPWLFRLLLRAALSSDRYPPLPSPEASGYFSHVELIQSLNGQAESMRYSQSGHTISTRAVPVYSDERVIGAVFIEQNARSLIGFTEQAFSRLLLYSIAVSIASALILFLYASWLSFRIGSLSRSANDAISESGKINDQFRSSKLNDEIGDLSRSFAHLLSRLKEYTHYLKTLSSKLSHELRTPLAIVSSSLDNLDHEHLPDQARTYANRAKEGTRRLSGILNAMSAASRVEQAIGSAELELIPVDELLQNLGAAYADVYPHVNMALRIQPNKEDYTLLAAGELLVQMLDKLVDNAADFCPNGGTIELGLYQQQSELVITVRNEGPPLPQTMQAQLFDSMVSVRDNAPKGQSNKEGKTTDHAPGQSPGKASDKGSNKSTGKTPSEQHDQKQTAADGHHLGLGLYIVRLIVDFHQGQVEGYNAPDQDSVIFEVRLPVRR